MALQGPSAYSETGLLGDSIGPSHRIGVELDVPFLLAVGRFEHLSQEVPFFLGGKVQLFADMENFLNMLNSDWGALRQVAFPYRASLVDVTCLQANGAAVTTAGQACARYQYSNFREPGLTTYTNYSIWQVRLGIRLDFKGL